MKIVNIEDYFHPDTGYQITVLSKYLASFGHDVTIVTSTMDTIPPFLTEFFGKEDIEERDRLYTERTGVKIIRVPMYAYKSGRAINKPGFCKFIDSLRPDMLYIHGESSLIAMEFLLRYKKLKYGLIFDSHMHDDACANPFSGVFHKFYRALFAPIINRESLVVIRVQNSRYIEDSLGISLKNSPFISFGCDMLNFKGKTDARQEFRRENGIGESDFVIVYAGKLVKDKGGQFYADVIKEKFEAPDGRTPVFMIVGNSPLDDYGRLLDKTLSESQNRVLRFPTQKYSDLPKFFQASDLGVIPNEGSLTFFDMQGCGLPVIWSDEALNVERVQNGNGFTFKLLDGKDLRRKIQACISMPRQEFNVIRENASNYVTENFNYASIASEYERIIKAEYHRQKADKGF